ncbi:MAG: integrase [Lachnospiraceae bacterium]|nr:integrase [Lachnospiraceae bacterium]
MANKHLSYNEQLDADNTMKLRKVIKTLPNFAADYFRALSTTTTTKTRISYVYDIRLFFKFLIEFNPIYKKRETTDFVIEDLDNVTALDIEEYLDYLKAYYCDNNSDKELVTNDNRGIHRKLSSLRSFYAYFYKKQMIKTNPTLLVDMPKLRKKEIIRLDSDEVTELLELVEHGGDNLTGMKKVYYDKNKERNIAIFTLLLGTGIRVSECVGLDINDIDFKHNRIKIIRKGQKEDFVYFGQEVFNALSDYLDVRDKIVALPGHEDAFFLSIRKRRISVQGIEDLVRQYASQITTFKHITPHKLRSTYGTNLYRETGDIYLVAEVLGHNDVNTTRKHYAALDEDRKRMAASAVTLHKK